MKASFWNPILVGLLLILSLTVCWSAVRYYFSVRELQQLQGEVLRMRQTMAAVQTLINRCVEYQKYNPAMTEILTPYGISVTNTVQGPTQNIEESTVDPLTPLTPVGTDSLDLDTGPNP